MTLLTSVQSKRGRRPQLNRTLPAGGANSANVSAESKWLQLVYPRPGPVLCKRQRRVKGAEGPRQMILSKPAAPTLLASAQSQRGRRPQLKHSFHAAGPYSANVSAESKGPKGPPIFDFCFSGTILFCKKSMVPDKQKSNILTSTDEYRANAANFPYVNPTPKRSKSQETLSVLGK